MSNQEQIPEHLRMLLQAFASHIATALSRAIRIHELALLDLFDHALAASLTKSTVVEAAQEFIDIVVGQKDLFETDMVYIRLASPDRRELRLVAGSGEYYRKAHRIRSVISVDDPSPSSTAFRSGEDMWVNNVNDDVRFLKFKARMRKTAAGRALRIQKSFVNLLIRARDEDPPIGVVTIAATTPWFFSESLWRSLKTIGQRLFFVIKRAEEVEAECRTASEREFLLKMTPPLSDLNLKTSLQQHARRIAAAARADVVSFYLWDPERCLLVLRGQHGWKSDMIGKAAYQLGEGMTGRLAEYDQPILISDLAAWKGDNKVSGNEAEYGKQMFGARPHDTYEVIGIPLRFKEDFLGVLTMSNSMHFGHSVSRFATTNTDVIVQVAHDISAFVFAMREYEAASFRVQSAVRLENFGTCLLQGVPDVAELASRVTGLIKNSNPVGATAIFLTTEDASVLRLTGSAGLSRAVDHDSSLSEIPVADTVLGNVFTSPHKLFKYPNSDDNQHPSLALVKRLLPLVGMRSFLALPLRDDQRDPIGVLAFWNIRNRSGEEYTWFTELDVDEFTRLSSFIARAIDRRRLETREQQTVKELREKDRLLYGSAIVGHLTHDLRNCMSAIVSDVRTLVDEAHDDIERARLKRVDTVAEGLVRRVNRYFDAIRRGIAAEHEEVDIGDTLQSAIERAEDKAAQRSVTIKYSRCGAVILRGSEIDLKEALFNVINNGINAMQAGGTMSISLSVWPAKGHVSITISDTGKGMHEDEIAEALGGHRGDGTTRPTMGLFLTRFVIGQHGGTFELSSKPQKGTTATIRLPILR